MNDLEIAAHFQISERTVRYWRKNAIAEIKRWYQVNHTKLDYPSQQDWQEPSHGGGNAMHA